MKSHLLILTCLMPGLAAGYIRKEYEGWDCNFEPESPHLITYKNAKGSVDKLCGGGVKCLKPGTDNESKETFVMCPYPEVSCFPGDANICARTPVKTFDISHWLDGKLRGTGQLGNDFK